MSEHGVPSAQDVRCGDAHVLPLRRSAGLGYRPADDRVIAYSVSIMRNVSERMKNGTLNLICNPLPMLKDAKPPAKQLESFGVAWTVLGIPEEQRLLDCKLFGLFSTQIASSSSRVVAAKIQNWKLEEFVTDTREHFLALLGLFPVLHLTFERGAIDGETRAVQCLGPPEIAAAIARTLGGGLEREFGFQRQVFTCAVVRDRKARSYSMTPYSADLAAEITAKFAADQSAVDVYRALWLRPQARG